MSRVHLVLPILLIAAVASADKGAAKTTILRAPANAHIAFRTVVPSVPLGPTVSVKDALARVYANRANLPKHGVVLLHANAVMGGGWERFVATPDGLFFQRGYTNRQEMTVTEQRPIVPKLGDRIGLRLRGEKPMSIGHAAGRTFVGYAGWHLRGNEILRNAEQAATRP